jgi:protein-L-isoaspartate(D-aspartate) O-methyltransferase
MVDSFRHQGLRKQLIEHLASKGIVNLEVLNAMNKIPRHLFLDNAFVNFAYQDKAFPIGAGQTISQPYTVAFQSELLQINPYERVLEVGTGSGYQAAVLSLLDAEVFTIERQRELFLKTKKFLPTLGYNCMFVYGDGYKGLPKFAPFDKIIITCGAPFVPEDLVAQLKVGGRMVAPIGDGNIQVMHLIEKISETETRVTTHGKFSFVPMLNDKNNGI